MLVWLGMLMSIILFWVLIPDALGKKKKNQIFLILSCLSIAFVMGSRAPQMMNSLDLQNYYRMFVMSGQVSMEKLVMKYETIEKGFLLLNKIISYFSPWPYTFQYVEALFCTSVMFWYINRNTEDVFMGVLIYLCFGPWQFFLTGFRQAFAISLCFIALEILKKHKFTSDVLGVGLILLATTLHLTAWIFVTIIFLRNLKFSKKLIVTCAAITTILFGLLPFILEFGKNVMNKAHTIHYEGNILGGLIPICVYVGTLILVHLIESEEKGYVQSRNPELVILLVGLCLYTLRYSAIVMERISFYFTPVISVVLSDAIVRQKNKVNRNIIYAIVIVLVLMLFAYRAKSQFGNYVYFWTYEELVDLVYDV